MRNPKFLLALVLAVFAFGLVACGDDDDAPAASGDEADASDDSGPGDDAFPVIVDSNGTEITIEARPAAIVSISPTATEMVFAVGAGDAVVAVDDYSTYPPDAPVTDLSAYEPNLEAILGYSPDLVLVGDGAEHIVDGLASAGVPSLVLPAAATLDDTYTQIEKVGVATGNVAEAAAVVADMQSEVDALLASIQDSEDAPTYFHELDEALYTVTSDTFIGQLYELAGFVNIADAVAEGNDYPQLSAEFILHADPDFIFLADVQCCAQDATTVAARAGWSVLSAVEDGHIVELDEDVASRWGPRVVEFLETIIDARVNVDA